MPGRLWTEYEESWLRQVWPKTAIPSKAIARALKRTVTAIRLKARGLEIKRPWSGSPEQKEQLKRMQEDWNGSPKHMEHLARLHETWVGSPEHLKAIKRMQKRVREVWVGSPQHLEHLKQIHDVWVGSPGHLEHLKRLHKIWSSSPKNLENLRQAGKKLRERPTWPEARFYGLVFGYDGLSEEFHAQELIPTSVCNHTVDGRWRDTIFELDGGGHDAFEDRTEHDLLIDAEYQKMGYRVVRAESSSDLFLRFLQVVH